MKLIEIGLLTPPVGIQSYVLKGVAPHLKLQDIFVGFTPFVIVDIVVNIGLLTAFPVMALYLPSRMG